MRTLIGKVSHFMMGCCWGSGAFASIPGFGAGGPCLSAGTVRMAFTRGARTLPGSFLLCPAHGDALEELLAARNATEEAARG